MSLFHRNAFSFSSRFITGTVMMPTMVVASLALGGMASVKAAPVDGLDAGSSANKLGIEVNPSQAAIDAIAPEKLSDEGLTPEQYAFKQEVYRRHVARGIDAGRTRIFDLPPSELALIPGTEIPMRKDAAKHLGRLLKAARSDLKRDLKSKSQDPESLERQARARQVRALSVGNAYRSASRQFNIWNRNFKRYLEATAEQRTAAPGGEYSSAAADLLREYIGIRVAAPGFSNHQGGIAVDFSLQLQPDPLAPTGAQELGASTAQQGAWEASWFWNWLKRRAGEFGFVEYKPEAWHWEYKPEQAAEEAKIQR